MCVYSQACLKPEMAKGHLTMPVNPYYNYCELHETDPSGIQDSHSVISCFKHIRTSQPELCAKTRMLE